MDKVTDILKKSKWLFLLALNVESITTYSVKERIGNIAYRMTFKKNIVN